MHNGGLGPGSVVSIPKGAIEARHGFFVIFDFWLVSIPKGAIEAFED